MSDPKEHTEGLRPFFERFQTATARSDAGKLIELYASNVLVAAPAGATVVSSSALLGAVSRRARLFEEAGHRQTTLIGFEETPLTPRYSLARAEWQWVFEPTGGEPTTVTLPSTFVVDRSGDAPQILVYIPHDDVTAVLRQRGLLAS